MRIYLPSSVDIQRLACKCLSIGSYCALCQSHTDANIDLCKSCLSLFKRCQHRDREGVLSRLCAGCGFERRGASIEHDSSPYYCEDCEPTQGMFLQRIVAPYRYSFPVDQLIKRIKYRQDRQLTRVLGTLMAQQVQLECVEDLPDLIVPMPLHANRYSMRGFNQSQDLANWLAKPLGLPVRADLVRRIEDTGSLAGLSKLARQQRILGAFRASDAVKGKRLAIVDDVLTTGSTARELARELYDSGAESVELWVLARTSSRLSGN